MAGVIQRVRHALELWCDEVGLSVNPDKTELIALTRKRKLGSLNHIFLGYNSMSVKYLGVVLDSRLTWREHVDVKARKAHNLLWPCIKA